METKNKKVALVTGASAGLGKDFVKALLSEGYIVYAVARRVEKMTDLNQAGAIALKMDITKEQDIRAIVETIQQDHGGVDLLINNAGFGLYGAMEEVSLDDARYQFEVNLFGLARLTQLLLPHMRKSKSGKIINISSIGGKIYGPLGSWYHATKHALEGWSDCLRLELAKFGIKVVIIEPGAIRTEFGDVMLEPMMKRSGTGPYAPLVQSMVNLFRSEIDKKGGGSPPSVITDLILKAVRSKQPKTRYFAGKYARPMLFIRKWGGDRVFDRMISGMIK